MRELEDIKKVLRDHFEELKRDYGIKRLAIFGSYARKECTEISDIDILVEFERPIGLKFIELAEYLEKILEIKVDLLTPNALKQKPKLWESVKEDLVYV